MKENIAPLAIIGGVVDPEGAKLVTQAKPRPTSSGARWNTACDSILLDKLAGVKAQGRQADNTGWHADAYTLCAEKLEVLPVRRRAEDLQRWRRCVCGCSARCDTL